MRIAHVKEKSASDMENVANAENIMPSLNIPDLLPVKRGRRDLKCCFVMRRILHNMLHERYDFARTQEILGQNMYDGLEILEKVYDSQ